MTDDEREAQMVISRWIHKVTGTSELERGIRKVGEEFSHAMQGVWDAVREALAPMQSITDQKELE